MEENPQRPDHCAQTRDALAGFLEIERSSPAEAMARHPALWPHLQRCPTCFADYLAARALLAAERAGAIPALRLPAAPVRPRTPVAPRRIILTRPMLMRALPAAGPLRGEQHQEQEHTLFDAFTPAPQSRIVIIVEPQPAHGWSLLVHVIPPIDGRVELTAGPHQAQAPFHADGVATLTSLPPALFTDPTAPDLMITLVAPTSTGDQ